MVFPLFAHPSSEYGGDNLKMSSIPASGADFPIPSKLVIDDALERSPQAAETHHLLQIPVFPMD